VHTDRVSTPEKKGPRKMALVSNGTVQKKRHLITYIFKVVINFFQNAGVKVQNLELSGISYFTLSYKTLIT
jgi:hypothetical protein